MIRPIRALFRGKERIMRVVNAWDLSIVKQYMVDNGIYAKEEIDAVEVEYKRYIALCALCPDQRFPMSEKVDPFWHTHILFTEDYHRFCKATIGEYLHHRPSILDDEATLTQSFTNNTVRMYEHHFGQPHKRFWNKAICFGGVDRPMMDFA